LEKVRAAIAGATGYGGIEAVRLLARHPGVELSYLSSETYQGSRLDEVYPHLKGISNRLEQFEPAEAVRRADAILLALPAGHAMNLAPKLLEAGKKVIDFGPDFRLKCAQGTSASGGNVSIYEQYYKMSHASPDFLAEAVYGLPELHREELRVARLAAVPGCYPTGALLAIAPLLREGIIESDGIVIDSKSGVSGVGRTSVSLEYHFSELNEDTWAYQVTSHRHRPEIEQELSAIAGKQVVVSFTPHVVPMTRGIFTTVYAGLSRKASSAELASVLRAAYESEPFVQVLDGDKLPRTKSTSGSNLCHLAVRADERAHRAIVLSAIDNLGKGLAGTAVQCLNIMFDFPETTGLDHPGIYP
jgi:N-acetyl-gamma-glutamyl-phosphate reductase